jgi:hypothetical protein
MTISRRNLLKWALPSSLFGLIYGAKANTQNLSATELSEATKGTHVQLSSENGGDFLLRKQLESSTGASFVNTLSQNTIQTSLNKLSPYYAHGSFSDGATINNEYEMLFSHTDKHGNDYWWSYVGMEGFPVIVKPGDKPGNDWILVVTGEFCVPLAINQNINGVKSLTSTTVTYSVPDTSEFILGRYAMINSVERDGLFYCGVFKVVGLSGTNVELLQSNSMITKNGAKSFGYCKIRPMNFIVESPAGVTINGSVKKIEGVIFDGQDLSRFGLVLGGANNMSGERRNAASVGNLSSCGFINLRRKGELTDDVVGILVANGSSLGITDVAVNGTKIGIQTYRNGSLIGSGAYIYDASNDAFKAEFTCNNYIYYCSAIKCGSGYTSRYCSGGEYATIVCADAIYGSLSQFNSYCSVRNFHFYKMSSAGVYATDDGYMLVAGNSIIESCKYSFRSSQGGSIEQQNKNAKIKEYKCSFGYIVNSASLRLNYRFVDQSGVDAWNGSGEIIVNGKDESTVRCRVNTSIPPLGRVSIPVKFPFKFEESTGRVIRFGFSYSESLQSDEVEFFPPAKISENACNIYLRNFTNKSVEIDCEIDVYVH